MLWGFCRSHRLFQMMLTCQNRQLRITFSYGSFIKNMCNSTVITVPADLICNIVLENHKSKITAICPWGQWYYSDVIMSMIASQMTSISIVCPTIGDQRKHQSSTSLAFVYISLDTMHIISLAVICLDGICALYHKNIQKASYDL